MKFAIEQNVVTRWTFILQCTAIAEYAMVNLSVHMSVTLWYCVKTREWQRDAVFTIRSVSYTHLTLPTNREV